MERRNTNKFERISFVSTCVW